MTNKLNRAFSHRTHVNCLRNLTFRVELSGKETSKRGRIERELDMDDRDWNLLNKQMKSQPPLSPRNGLMMLILAAGFLTGIAAGSSLFETQHSAQTAPGGGKTALAFFLDGGRNPTR